MDIFKFNSDWNSGEAISNFDSLMWIERYQEPGEFEIKALLGSGLREALPVGSYISHANTYEIMMVENHEIEEDFSEEATIKITGRSLDAWLENRVVGADRDTANTGSIPEKTVASDYTYNQAVNLINAYTFNAHVYVPAASDITATLEAVSVISQGGNFTEQIERVLRRGNLHKELLKILQVEDLGIKSIRPHPNDPFPGDNSKAALCVHDGNVVSDRVIFSYEGGDVLEADYFWTNRALKNCALVVGKYVERVVLGSESGLDRRWMLVDGSEVDESFTDPPTGADLTAVGIKLENLGAQALKAQNDKNIVSVRVAQTTPFIYRNDYNIGDVVTVQGNFGTSQQMRVTEYVEIEDENGGTGSPTLSVLEN